MKNQTAANNVSATATATASVSLSEIVAARSRLNGAINYTQCPDSAARSEVTGARWDEIDFEQKTWTVPKQRMKANREHRVPRGDRPGSPSRVADDDRHRARREDGVAAEARGAPVSPALPSRHAGARRLGHRLGLRHVHQPPVIRLRRDDLHRKPAAPGLRRAHARMGAHVRPARARPERRLPARRRAA